MVIKNAKDKIIMFLLFFNFLSAIYIPCLGHYINNISIYYLAINIITFSLIFIFTQKIRFRKFVLFIIGDYILLIVPTIIKNGSKYSLLFEFGVAILSFTIWGSFEKEKLIKYLRVPTFAFKLLAYINFIIVILFPEGLYHVSTIRNYYLFDHVNVSIRYLLPGTTMVLLIDYLKKNKISKKSIIYIIVVISTLILTKPITGIFGYVIFLISLLVLSICNIRKIISPFKSFLTTGIISLLIIGINFQNYFQKFIENVLHKDVTFSGRIEIWNKAITYIQKNWLIGNGRLDSTNRTELLGASSAHNQFLNFLFEGGTLLLIYIFYNIFIFSRKLLGCNNKKVVNVFVATMISYAFMWITEPFSYSGTFALFFIWMLMYYSQNLFNIEKEEQKSS